MENPEQKISDVCIFTMIKKLLFSYDWIDYLKWLFIGTDIFKGWL